MPVRTDRHLAQIRKISRFHQQPAHPQHLQRFRHRLRNARALIKKHIPSDPTPITTTVSSNRNDSFGNADICFALSSPTDTAKISVNTATSEGKSSGTFTKKLPGTI